MGRLSCRENNVGQQRYKKMRKKKGGGLQHSAALLYGLLVGTAGFEPATT